MPGRDLQGITVLVAGAGLAGLTAAHDLERRGARVTLVEARDRVGGRVWTLREGFAEKQHAEAGADLVEEEQAHVHALARELGLTPRRILRSGFGFYSANVTRARRVDVTGRAFGLLARRMKSAIDDFKAADKRWDSAVGQVLAGMSVAQWLDRVKASAEVRAIARGFRGFFLADPEDLSLLPMVEQFAAWGTPGQDRIYRIPEGNDRLATLLAKRLRGRLLLRAILRRVRQTARRVTASVEVKGRLSQIAADFLVCALPASTARDVEMDDAAPQRQAMSTLRYGCATRLLLQFERRFWRKLGRPTAFGSDASTGAVWDGNELQRGPAMLTFLAGGRASAEVQQLLRAGGDVALLRQIEWLGRPTRLLALQHVTWEDDPWARGGYAYFDPDFDPRWRPWLSRPAGRLVFAGEHTSLKWQGYMNGAIESGKRAAAEIAALHMRAGDLLSSC